MYMQNYVRRPVQEVKVEYDREEIKEDRRKKSSKKRMKRDKDYDRKYGYDEDRWN